VLALVLCLAFQVIALAVGHVELARMTEALAACEQRHAACGAALYACETDAVQPVPEAAPAGPASAGLGAGQQQLERQVQAILAPHNGQRQ
jgi:hypothetical protein